MKGERESRSQNLEFGILKPGDGRQRRYRRQRRERRLARRSFRSFERRAKSGNAGSAAIAGIAGNELKSRQQVFCPVSFLHTKQAGRG
jgi:hypothetical protein